MSIWTLHAGTLALSAALLTAFSGLMAFVLARVLPVGAPAARSWGWTMTAASMALLFWFLGQAAGYWAEFLAGNLAALLGGVLFLRSLGLLTGQPIPPGLSIAQFAIGAVAIALVQFGFVPKPVAVVSIALSLLVGAVGGIVVIARHRQIRASPWGRALIAVLTGWCVCVFCVRLYELFLGGGVEAVRPLADTPVAAVVMVAATLMLMVVSKGFLAILADQHRQAELENARRDGLTGAFTRAAFFEEAHKAIATSGPFAVLMIDVDHFKKVNDRFGHQIGDVVLRHVALQVLRMVRSHDLVGRYGGEEFCVLLPDCDEAEARRVADRLCEESARHPARLPDGSALPFTVSVGVATAIAAGRVEAALDSAVGHADRALYRAKAMGRNQVQRYADEAVEALAGRQLP